jgi:hypothetical protein
MQTREKGPLINVDKWKILLDITIIARKCDDFFNYQYQIWN